MPTLLERVAPAAAALLPPPPAPLLLAVSGGCDSVVLVEVMATLAAWPLTIYHLDHGLRPAATDDAAFVRALAAARHLPCIVERVDVPALAASARRGIEDMARRERYRRLRACAQHLHCAAILTAHHEDDQAETVLLQLLRGAAADQQRGMRASRSLEGMPLVRPFLAIARAELRAFASERGLAWREDDSNRDERFRRNHLRHQVLPALEAAVPGVRAALLERTRSVGPPAPTPEQRLVRALTSRGLVPTRARLRLLDAVRRGPPGRPVRVAGHLVVREADRVVWLPAGTRGAGAIAVHAPCSVGRDQELLLLRLLPAPADPRLPPGRAWLDPEAVRWPLCWRTVLPGDRWQPLGAPGHQQVWKSLADRHVPWYRRRQASVLADAAGVVWVPGLGIADRVRLRPGATTALAGWHLGPAHDGGEDLPAL